MTADEQARGPRCQRCKERPVHRRVHAPGRVPFDADLCRECLAAWEIYQSSARIARGFVHNMRAGFRVDVVF